MSQPWLVEAVGTAEWTGVPLRLLLDEAGVGADAVEAAFGGPITASSAESSRTTGGVCHWRWPWATIRTCWWRTA